VGGGLTCRKPTKEVLESVGYLTLCLCTKTVLTGKRFAISSY
jgi:hypothetical protein